jgi:hypothetical protein
MAKKVIRKRVKKAKHQVSKTDQGETFVDVPQAPSFLDEPRFSINEFNESMNQFSKQAGEVLVQTHDDAVQNTHIKSFLTMAKALPAECTVTMITADAVRAIAKELAA